MDKITETREFLIKKCGEPVEKTLPDGKKYSYVNMDLKIFDDLLNAMKKLSLLYKVELKSEHINPMVTLAQLRCAH